MPLSQYLSALLQEQYFETLEENEIDYIVYTDVSTDPIQEYSYIKEEFNLSEEEMAIELGYKSLKDWEVEHDN